MSANISRAEELENIEKVWPAGTGDVGLFRTEEVLTARRVVGEEEPQYEMYCQLVNAPHTDTPIIRLVDWGGEKTKTDYTHDGSQMRDRGIRHSLLNEKTREVLRVQLRALLRASEHGSVNILVPMVTDVEEIDEVYKELQRSREELAERGVFPPVENTSLGVMIEVGAAVDIIDDILLHVDFVNIGSGDLTQYSLAAERDFTAGSNPNWLKQFGPHHPSVLKKISEVVHAAKYANKKVHGCGDAFAHKRYAPILLGLDLDSISVPPTTAAGMYQEIAGLDYAVCKAFVGWAMFESGGRARAVFDELERFHECVKRGELWEPPKPKQTDSEPTQPEPIIIRT
jgi:phosphoenolpyruvate-protein kinase (PTS system EI component)